MVGVKKARHFFSYVCVMRGQQVETCQSCTSLNYAQQAAADVTGGQEVQWNTDIPKLKRHLNE